MPSLGDYKIYDTNEPCNYTGEKLVETMTNVVTEGLSKDGRELNLMQCCVGPNGINIIINDERVHNIKRLNLGGNKIVDLGAKVISRSPAFSNVNWLELGGNDLGAEGIELIVRSETFSKLKTPNLYRNYLKDDGALVLANENTLQKIEEMDLAQNEIGDEGLVALSKSTKFPNLVAICVDNNFGTREGRGVAKLGSNFKKLQSLNI